MNKQSLRNVWAIYTRELAGYFGSPVAYVFIVIFLLLLGFFTFYVSNFFEFGQADLRGFFQWHPWVFVILVPAVAMRLWAEEQRLGTIELLLTFPVSLPQIMLGKFLSAWSFLGIALLLTFPMVFTVIYLGQPDMGGVISGYLGSFLLAGAFLSVGQMTSSMTRSQVVSFILAVVISLFLILAGYPPVNAVLNGWGAPMVLVNLISDLSFLTHFISMQKGIIDLRDVLYFASVIGFMLFAGAVVIQNRRIA